MHYIDDIRLFFDNLVGSIAIAGCIWFCAWAIRRKGELDYPLDLPAKIIRWVAVAILMGIPANFPELPINTARILIFSGIAFLAWPNFAYHLTRFLRWCRLLPAAGPVAPDGPQRLQM